MYIDLHCHTKETKTGDGAKRNVSKEKFCEVLKGAEVGVVAITNHNYFSKSEFLDFYNYSKPLGLLVLPGVELDINVGNEQGHILFICSESDVDIFDERINSLLNGIDPNKFSKKLEDIVSTFSDLNVIVIAHHYLKEHGFSEFSCNIIKDKLCKCGPVMFEPSSLKSVGIMFANDIVGFIGSDVKDWNNYPKNKVPELKVPIDSFNKLLLLLKKDQNAIKTFIDSKSETVVSITPFIDEGDNSKVNLNIRNDVNIIFGGKGTGKSKIISSLKEYYCNLYGSAACTTYKGKESSSEYKNLITREADDSLLTLFGNKNLEVEINEIKHWIDYSPVMTASFYKGYSNKNISENYKKLGFRKADFTALIDETSYSTDLLNYKNISKALDLLNLGNYKRYVTEQEYLDLQKLLLKVKESAFNSYKKNYCNIKSLVLEKFTIESIKSVSLSKTGNFSIPSSTGILDQYNNAKKLKSNVKLVYDLLSTKSKIKDDTIGFLDGLGRIFVRTKVFLNPKEETSIFYKRGSLGAQKLKAIYSSLDDLNKSAYNENLVKLLTTFNQNSGNDFTKISDFIGIKYGQFLEKDDGSIEPHTASSGEESMLLLDNSLLDDNKKVYLLDEPELSVGHKYINDIIVPRIKELARANKIIIISTHDSNIAVRTIPFVSIYREYKNTYIGNLFTNELIDSSKNVKSWVETSIDYLEGGALAFEERKNSYGK